MSVQLPPMPGRIAALRLNPAGYPVPWFVDDGTADPDFRVIAPGKVVQAITGARCWVCGGVLGRYRSFVIGPMCAINRVSAEPPCHLDCATWSSMACPFLHNPSKRRRTGGLPQVLYSPGVMIERNPGVALVWTTRTTPLTFSDGAGGVLLRLGPPQHVEWWAQGRPATRDEVLESMLSGLPVLRRAALDQGGAALEALHRQLDLAMLLVPA